MRLAREVRSEAARRYRTTPEFAAAAGLSKSTIEAIYAAKHTDHWPSTRHKIQTALGWTDTSIERILAGGKPELVEDPALARIREIWPLLPARDRRLALAMIEELLDRR